MQARAKTHISRHTHQDRCRHTITQTIIRWCLRVLKRVNYFSNFQCPKIHPLKFTTTRWGPLPEDTPTKSDRPTVIFGRTRSYLVGFGQNRSNSVGFRFLVNSSYLVGFGRMDGFGRILIPGKFVKLVGSGRTQSDLVGFWFLVNWSYLVGFWFLVNWSYLVGFGCILIPG